MAEDQHARYEPLFFDEPTITPEALAPILPLQAGETVTHVSVTAMTQTNTARVLRVCAVISGREGERSLPLFIKTSQPHADGTGYDRISTREGAFYTLARACSLPALPIPHCYDAYLQTESGRFVLILEDMSDKTTPPNKESFAKEETWLACAESLARFHAAFWHDVRLGTGELSAGTPADIEQGIRDAEAQCERFIHDFTGRVEQAYLDAIQHAMAIHAALTREKNDERERQNTITLCHGDAHIYNYLLPREQNGAPVMVDFQFWSDGFGTGDLAHLTRVNFPDSMMGEAEIRIVRHYYDTLLHCGVADYSWDKCLRSYRREVAAMLLIPVWQYTAFAVPFESWQANLPETLRHYQAMDCARLDERSICAQKDDILLKDIDFMYGDGLFLKLRAMTPGNPDKQFVPAYHFTICLPDGTEAGECGLRVGSNEKLYYGGHISYTVFEPYRGHHLAARACELLKELARKHGMPFVRITCNVSNQASARTCELAGGVLEAIENLPAFSDMYQEGIQTVKIYRISLES